MGVTSPRRAHGKSAGTVNSVSAVVLLLVIGVYATAASQSTPPAIAELAPNPRQQIASAPPEQSSRFGKGQGGAPSSEGGPAPSPAPSLLTTGPTFSPPALVERSRRRHCIGNPPRQTEDPQSPPCVDYWAGDNGGATSFGVTRDEITVALPAGAPPLARQEQAMEDYLNSRFEFYGRKIRFVRFSPTAGDRDTGTGAHADADTVAAMKAFASLGVDGQRNAPLFYDALARKKILSVTGYPVLADDSHFARMAPYQWSYVPGTQVVGENLGNFSCQSLAGRAAKWGGSGSSGAKRVFGLITSSNPDGSKADARPLRAALKRCGVEFAAEEDIPDAFPPPKAATTSAVIRMASKNVTTILTLAHSYALVYIKAEATNQAYFPEWIQSSFGFSDEDLSGSQHEASQQQHTFGMTFYNKAFPSPQLIWTQAIHEVDPSFLWQSDLEAQTFKYEYESMLLLASGIQAAGPRLTPDSFQKGLFTANFPNPGADGPPYYQAGVDFGPGDHVMNDSASLIWWNPNERSYQSSPGAFCYGGLGRRYLAGSWPSGWAPLFGDAGACR